VVLERGEGVWVWDVDGKKYLDMLSAYSALNQGHRHPDIIAAAREQMDRKVTLTSRAFHNDRMGPFLRELCELTGFDKALPMNTGAEAVETAIKAARKWGYRVKGVPEDKAEIIVCNGQLPRPHDDDRQLLVRGAVPRRLRPLHPRLQGWCRTATPTRSSGDHREHRGLPGRADPGRGRRRGSAGRLPRAPASSAPSTTCCSWRRDPDGLGRTGRMFAYEWEGIRPTC
jgi:ornithine--oxo-acid transaminase